MDNQPQSAVYRPCRSATLDQHVFHNHDHDSVHDLYAEITCHVPYAIFAVAIGLGILSILSFLSADTIFENPDFFRKSARMMFHSFHFMHIAFAATGTVLTFMRFSTNRVAALIVGIISPMVFCTLSDAILPYLGGIALGVPMHFHLCFLTEYKNIIPFFVIGIVNGFILGSRGENHRTIYSLFSHAAHIIISSLASIFYLVAQGFVQWHLQIGFVFLFLIIAVVVPCTISDIIIPMVVARAGKGYEKHTT
jgi:hypothetical protein